jgi:hypothetical protein
MPFESCHIMLDEYEKMVYCKEQSLGLLVKNDVKEERWI